MKRVLFIVNPRSGKGSIKYHILDILDTFSKKGIDVTVHITQERLDACRTAMEEGGNYDEIVLSGGDGTLDEVVSGLMKGGHDTPVGYIPAGSTNDFASSLKLPVRMGDAAKIAVSGAPRRFDVGAFNDQYFIYIGVGISYVKSRIIPLLRVFCRSHILHHPHNIPAFYRHLYTSPHRL